MKKALVVSAVILAAMPAHAWVHVTNLSGKPQSVSMSSAGATRTLNLAPDETGYFHGSDGMLALNTPETIQQAQRAKPGIGGEIFGDVIASNRTSRIPANDGETYVIWPDGRLLIQGKRGREGKTF